MPLHSHKNGLYLDFTGGHLLEFNANRKHVDYQVDRKDHQKERAEVVKHLREEVPP
jgi:hypothetical protein